MSQDEDQQLRALLNPLAMVEQWQQQTGQLSDAWRVDKGSDLEGDDAAIYPYHLSSATWVAITAAVDHAACLRDSLLVWAKPDQVTVRLHTHGQLTLIRGALENASRAAWLLESGDRPTRTLRRLQQEWSETGERERMEDLLGIPPRKPKKLVFDELSALATKVGANPAKIKDGVRYRDVVEAAGSLVPSGAKISVFVWKACSANAHGELMGAINYLNAESIGQVAPGVGLRRITANVKLTVTGTMAALATIKVAMDLYGRRARP